MIKKTDGAQKPDEPRRPVEPPVTRPGIVQPMIDELKGTPRTPQVDLNVPPQGPLHPAEPANPEPGEFDPGASGEDHPDPPNSEI